MQTKDDTLAGWLAGMLEFSQAETMTQAKMNAPQLFK